MASMLIGAFPVASSFTPSSYVRKASWYKTEKIKNDEYPITLRHNLKKHHYRCIGVGSNCARSFVVNAAATTTTSGESFESDEAQDPNMKNVQECPKSFWGSTKYSLDVFFKFVKPYVLIGSVISTISVSLLAVGKLSDISPKYFIGLFQAIVIAISMSSYVGCFNHFSDIEIDKINKPYRPLASGDYSIGTGVIITASCLILCFGLGWIVGSPPLLWALFIQCFTGTVYSIDLPFLRWKRFAVLAAMCIVVLQGIVPQLAIFLHMQTFVFKRPPVFPRSLIFATTFLSFFSAVMALFKDIPDTEGDRKFGIQSLSVRLGQKRVFWICISLFKMIYGVAILVGATSSCLWSKMIMVLGHGLLASILLYHAKSVDPESNSAMESFYMFIWKLFYAEYLIIPLIR